MKEQKQDNKEETPIDPSLDLVFNGKTIVDGNDRLLVKMDEKTASVIYPRYVDMREEVKEVVATFVSSATGEDKKQIMSFLNFEDDDEAFCS